jgi:hypothetical protein
MVGDAATQAANSVTFTSSAQGEISRLLTNLNPLQEPLNPVANVISDHAHLIHG